MTRARTFRFRCIIGSVIRYITPLTRAVDSEIDQTITQLFSDLEAINLRARGTHQPSLPPTIVVSIGGYGLWGARGVWVTFSIHQ